MITVISAAPAQVSQMPPLKPNGRLTAQSGVPVTTADISKVRTLYYTSRMVPLYDGSQWKNVATGGELSFYFTSPLASGQVRDFFIENTTGTPRLVAGPAWTSASVRAAAGAIGRNVGDFYTNSVSMAANFTSGGSVTVPANQGLFIGTIAVAEDDFANPCIYDTIQYRYLWNMYNRVPRLLFRQDPAGTWTWSTIAWRIANNLNVNQVGIVCGWIEDCVEIFLHTMAANSTASGRFCYSTISIDSYIAGPNLDVVCGAMGVLNIAGTKNVVVHDGFPLLGLHSYYWLEYGGGSDVQTWYGGGITGLAGTWLA